MHQVEGSTNSLYLLTPTRSWLQPPKSQPPISEEGPILNELQLTLPQPYHPKNEQDSTYSIDIYFPRTPIIAQAPPYNHYLHQLIFYSIFLSI